MTALGVAGADGAKIKLQSIRIDNRVESNAVLQVDASRCANGGIYRGRRQVGAKHRGIASLEVSFPAISIPIGGFAELRVQYLDLR